MYMNSRVECWDILSYDSKLDTGKNYSGINWSIWLSLSCSDCDWIWAGTDGDSQRRKNGGVKGAGKGSRNA